MHVGCGSIQASAFDGELLASGRVSSLVVDTGDGWHDSHVIAVGVLVVAVNGGELLLVSVSSTMKPWSHDRIRVADFIDNSSPDDVQMPVEVLKLGAVRVHEWLSEHLDVVKDHLDTRQEVGLEAECACLLWVD